MQRSVIGIISIAIVIAMSFSSAKAAGTLTTILENGPRDNRLNLVFIGDGYTAAEEGKFATDVDAILAHMLNKAPFGEYSSFLNAHAIYVASNESGADHPSQAIYKDTYLDGTFEVAGITRLTGISSTGYNRVFNMLAEHVPEYDMVLVILNDLQYGGSGGSIAITSINSAAPEISLHELGHSFGSLADEYDTYTPGYSGREDENTTAQTDRTLIKWKAWIDGSTPVPTPETSTYGSDVGLFEGACYETTGWYRPMLNCEMRSLNQPFCPVCSEQLIKMEYNRLNIIEDYSPLAPLVELAGGTSIDLSVTTLVPTGHPMTYSWFDNNVLIDGETASTFVATTFGLTDGSHQLRVEVSDATDLVRTDAANLLKASHSWTVEVSAGCCGQYLSGLTGNADCSPDGSRNLADITRLIDYVYISKAALCCEESGDVDGSIGGKVNLADITRLIDNVYISKVETALCQ